MANLELPFGVKVLTDAPLDGKYFNGTVPYASVLEVNTLLPESARHIGLTVNIANVEYCYKLGVTNGDLVVKLIDETVSAQISNAIAAQITNSTALSDPTISIVELGNVHILGVSPGTYPNWGGMVVPANNFATLKRVNGVYSVSLTPIDVSGKVNVSDVIDTLNSTETSKPSSADAVRRVNEKFVDYAKTTDLNDKADLVAGKNKLNKLTGVVGYVVHWNGSIESSATQYTASDFIPILPNTNYFLSNSGNNYRAYYDINKVYISGEGTGDSSNVICNTPINAYFIRVSCKNSSLNTAQLEIGNFATVYEAFKKIVADNEISLTIARTSDIPSVSDFVKKEFSKNKFNKLTVTIGYYVEGGNGLLFYGNETYAASDFIPILPSTNYTISNNGGSGYRAFYDQNKIYISGVNEDIGVSATWETPFNAYYLRTTVRVPNLEETQFELGNLATSYGAYEFVINESVIPSSIARTGGKYKGKKMMQYGDSITANPDYYLDEFIVMSQPSIFVNKGVSGDTIAQILTRLHADLIATPTLLNDIDLLSLYAGQNDYGGGTILGTVNDNPDTDNTFCAKYMKFLKTVFLTRPTQKLFLINVLNSTSSFPYWQPNTAGYTVLEMNQKISEIGLRYSVPVLDFNGKSGLNEFTIDDLTWDGCHPNNISGTQLARVQYAFIETIG